MPTRLGDRCVYESTFGRCSRTGSGNPPLCRFHYELVHYGGAGGHYAEAPSPPTDGRQVGDIFAELFRNPAFQAAAAFGLEELLRRAAQARARRQQRAQQSHYTEWPPRPGGRRPPPPPPPGGYPPPGRQVHRGPDPRQVLGFPPQVRLTAAMVRQRRRELAAQHHPDRGGDTERMQAINRAADALLAQLG